MTPPPGIPVGMELRDAMQQIALEFSSYGYRRITVEPAYSPIERVESLFYAGQSLSFQLSSANQQTTHRLAVYVCDYLQGESVTVEVLDSATGNVLNTQVLTSYTAGIYLVYNYQGNIAFVIKNNIQGPYVPWTAVAAFFWG